MKMKKILNEWRKFINEGASNEEIRNKEIAKINIFLLIVYDLS